MFNSDNLPHELLLRTRQTTKLRNAIENKIIKNNNIIIQSGGF